MRQNGGLAYVGAPEAESSSFLRTERAQVKGHKTRNNYGQQLTLIRKYMYTRLNTNSFTQTLIYLYIY